MLLQSVSEHQPVRLSLASGVYALGGSSLVFDDLTASELIIDGEAFLVKGICYSPIPVNESVYFAPYGDYFSADYSFICERAADRRDRGAEQERKEAARRCRIQQLGHQQGWRARRDG